MTPAAPATVIELAHAALCLDCQRIFDGDAAKCSCPKCASEAVLWLQAVLNREVARA